MATPKKTQIVITANAAVAKKVMDELQQRIDQIKAKMKGLDVTTKEGQKEFKKLEKELVSYNSAVSQNITNTERIKKAMDNLSKTSLNELKRALSAAKSELGKMSEADKGKLKQMQNNVKTLQGQIDKLTGSTKAHGGAWQTAIKNLTAYVGIFGAFNILKQHLTDIIRLNFKLSDQLADIRKVSGWAMEDVDALSKRLAKIDTRNSIQQLNDLAYQGAKLGIGKYGVDGLTRFAEATAQIRMALHEDMGDEAIAQLAKMAEVMHDMDNLGVSKALLASGSAIFKLGATTTATGSNIMEFSKRLLGLGKTADLTTPQILALGSAADSMALMPEVASTAFNKFITTLQSKYAQVAQAVGMNQERLKSLLDQHKTMDAIVEVLEHMRDMGDLNALAPIMGDLGSEGARLTNVFASMASNVQMLKDHLATSTEEFEKATAVTAEFDIQNETAQALMERAANIWEKTFVNSENAAGGVKDVAKAWYDMTKAITESGSFLVEAGLSLKVLLWSIQALIGAIPALINGLIYLGAVKAASWGGWSVMFNAAAASATRFGTSLANLVGIQTAAQKSAIAAAQANLAAAEAMMAEAHQAIALAEIKQMQAMTDEEVVAAETAMATATANAAAAQQALAAAMVEVSSLTGVEVSELALDANAKIYDTVHTNNLWAAEEFLATSESSVAAATAAQTAAIERDTAAKATNTATSKNLRLAWGALVFVAFVAVLDKLYENFKKLNAEEERNKDVTDKIVNGLANANKEYEDACKNLKILYGELERNWKIEDERKRLMGEINSRYGEYVGNLVDEATKVGDLTQSYNDATDALREYYFYKQKEALKADLVAEEQHKGDVSFMKLQNMGGQYQSNIDLRIAQNAIKEYARGGASSATIANQLWKDFFGGSAPGDYYMDLSKLPLVGGMFPKDTFRSEAQEAMTYLHDFVKSYVIAQNNEAVINKNFPGEWTPPVRPDKNSNNNTTPTAPDGETVKNDIAEFIANIKNFYKRQKTMLLESVADNPDITEAMQDDIARSIDKRLEAALANAKQAIVLGQSEWEEFKQTMDKDIKEHADETGQSQSTMLLEKIQGYDTAGMRQQLLAQHYKLRKKKLVENPVADARDRAYMDKMWLSASGDEEKAAKADVKYQRERQKILLEHDYTGLVNNNTTQQLERLGAFALNADQVQTLLGDDTEASKALIDARAAEIAELLTNARKNILNIYEADVTTDEGRASFLSMLLPDKTKETSELKAIFDLFGSDMQAFYLEIIKYTDEYTEAVKKADDERKKINAKNWSMKPETIAENKSLEGAEDVVKKEAIFGGNLDSDGEGGWKAQSVGAGISQGLGFNIDYENDPEIMLDRMRLESKQRYFEEVARLYAAGKATEDEYHDAQQQLVSAQNDMVKALAQNISEQTGNLMSFLSPLQSFGESVGEAFATMHDDASAGRKAIKSALKDMTKSFAKATLDIIQQNLMRQLNNELTNDAMLLQDSVYAGSKQTIAALMYANLLMQQAAFNGETLTMEAALTKAQVALDGAKATAKGFAQLGPIAGPIAIAAMMAVIGAALSYALSMAFGGSDTAKGSDAKTTNTKLVSGMLTYDSGNVHDLKPFFDRDGNMYWAEDNSDKANQGINLLTTPTATTINGQPSLVAENGPELVIGRETTQAIMQDNPALLRALYQYDRHHSGRTAYDQGNLSEQLASLSSAVAPGASGEGMTTALADATASNVALLTAVNALLQRLNEPISAKIDMYGRGNLYDSMTKANQFMKNK